jgi:ubiquinone/menaquinone biosynthesis C-methylase UbiE
MGIKHTLARHLRKPDGFVGKLVAVLMNRINDGMNRFTLEHLRLQPNDTVMEIGFGNGKYFPNVLKEVVNGRLVGLDYSETMVNQAKRK